MDTACQGFPLHGFAVDVEDIKAGLTRACSEGIMPLEASELARLFGEFLRDLRKTAGITQKDLAEAMGISDQTVIAIETGRRRVTDDMFEKWVRTVRQIARDRAQAVDAIITKTTSRPDSSAE